MVRPTGLHGGRHPQSLMDPTEVVAHEEHVHHRLVEVAKCERAEWRARLWIRGRAAGVTDRLWEVSDLVALLETWPPQQTA
jgi:hypothetical protein